MQIPIQWGIPNHIVKIMEKLKTAGFQAYLVGGSVRDMIMGQAPSDYDIATSAKPEDVEKLFHRVVKTGVLFGTVTIIGVNGSCEVTTMRREFDYADFRKPSYIESTDSLFEDLSRRDFTINALAYDGENLYDYFGGIDDIKHGTIKTVGDPLDRFSEDALRILRAVRLSAQLGFSINHTTQDGMQTNSWRLQRISKERITEELLRILNANYLRESLSLMIDLNIWHYLFPFSISGNNRSGINLTALDYYPKGIEYRLALITILFDQYQSTLDTSDSNRTSREICESNSSRWFDQLRLDNKAMRIIRSVRLEYLNIPYSSIVEVRKAMQRMGKNHFPSLMSVLRMMASMKGYLLSETVGWNQMMLDIIANHDPLTLADLAIKAQDLITLGIEAGPKIGRIMDLLLVLVMEDPHHNETNRLLDLASIIAQDIEGEA